MNNKMKKTLTLMVMGATVGTLSLPVLGTGTLQKVEAYLNKTLTYKLDGEEVMKDVAAITYNDTTYISVTALNEALGNTVSYDEKTRTITMNAQAPQTRDAGTEEVTPTLPEFFTIEKATIKEVNAENKQVTVLPAGLEDNYMNYIVLNAGETTNVRHELNRRAYRFEDLEVGMEVSAKHSPIMTMSLPGQTPAIEIVILQEQIEN